MNQFKKWCERTRAKWIGPVKIGMHKGKGWTRAMPLYLAYCKKHGYYHSTGHGWKERTLCPDCLENLE